MSVNERAAMFGKETTDIMRHSHNPYALKPVPPAPRSIRSSQTKAMEKIDTAAAQNLGDVV